MYPLHRWRALAHLSGEEEQALRGLGDDSFFVPSGKVLRKQGERVSGLYLLQQGWVASSLVLADERQIIQKVHLAGDMLGTPSMALLEAADTLIAITDATVAFVPFKRIAALYSAMPRLGALYTAAATTESAFLIEALVATGRLSAKERVARLILDFHKRLSLIGDVKDDAFNLPLTQRQIGDLTGLTNVHVNRILRKLCQTGLISRQHQTVRILDMSALRGLNPVASRSVSFEPAWLPAPS